MKKCFLCVFTLILLLSSCQSGKNLDTEHSDNVTKWLRHFTGKKLRQKENVDGGVAAVANAEPNGSAGDKGLFAP